MCVTSQPLINYPHFVRLPNVLNSFEEPHCTGTVKQI